MANERSAQAAARPTDKREGRDALRVFVAIPVPQAARPVFAQLVAALQSRLRTGGLRWLAPDQWHLTLRFLGATPVDRFQQLGAGLAEIAGRHAVAPCSLAGLTWWPTPKRASVLVTTLLTEERLQCLARATEDLAGACGYAAETRPFHAHVTLARVSDPRLAGGELPIPKSWPSFEASELVLYRSDTLPDGARYTTLARHALLASSPTQEPAAAGRSKLSSPRLRGEGAEGG